MRHERPQQRWRARRRVSGARRRGRLVRWVVAAHAVTILAGALGTVANAQLDEQTNKLEDTDRDTLRADQREDWTQVAGARYASGEVPDSPTPSDVDFFAVSFQSKLHGFAGGARCEHEGEDESTCTRVPAIYEYTQDENTGDATWHKSLPAPGKGYVAAIAWLGPDRALAVGGDGEYPRREQADGSDRAGNARAWLYENGGWRELTREAGELPAGMTALTALDYSTLRGFAVAGGVRQLWRWRDGTGFTPEQVVNPSLFRFRVRELRFVDEVQNPADRRVLAVTAGCCTPQGGGGEELNFPSLLRYDPAGDNWKAFLLGAGSGSGAEQLGPRQNLPDSYYSFTYRPRQQVGAGVVGPDLSVVLSPGGQLRDPEPASRIIRYPNERYADPLTPTRLVGDLGTDVVSPQEEILGTKPDAQTKPDAPNELIRRSARLLAAGEDQAGPKGGSDGLPDWTVGVRRDPDRADRGQGIALATHITRKGLSNPPFEGFDVVGGLQGITKYQPTSVEQVEQARQPQLQLLTSYGLNAIEMVGDTGIGWAVGDRGAILNINEGGALANEVQPDPPKLGAHELQRLGQHDPYDALRPQTAQRSGQVPAFADQPLERLAKPRFVSHGTPNPHPPPGGEDVGALVMSRDGREGWAIGPREPVAGAARGGLVLYHFDGRDWRPCDPDGACAGLAEAFDGFKKNVILTAAARVPLERDDDPANNDKFEVVAVGTWFDGDPKPVVLRYKDSRWHVEVKDKSGPIKQATLRGIAFTTPDDGWLIGAVQFAGEAANVYRFKGESDGFKGESDGWVACPGGKDAAVCDDPEGRLPLTAASRLDQWALASAGARVYMMANRQGPRPGGVDVPRSIYPMIISRDSSQRCEKPGDEGCWHAEPGGDPGFGKFVIDQLPPSPEQAVDAATAEATDRHEQGRVFSVSVAQRADGSYEGWAVGAFGGPAGRKLKAAPPFFVGLGEDQPLPDATVLRLERGRWQQWRNEDAASDYLQGEAPAPRQQLSLSGTAGPSPTFVAPPRFPAISFDGEAWRVLEAPFQPRGRFGSEGSIEALAPDGEGGFWAAVQRTTEGKPLGLAFYHHTDRAPRPVFEEAPQPLSGPLTALAGARDGSLWAVDSSATLARYDRLTGWEKTHIPGWDPGRLVTRASEVYALALAPDGTGVAVGRAGRIARIGPDGVQLDPAAGTVCDPAALKPPCGTSRSLRAVSVAPDGSALAGGDRLSLLWRPAGGEFRAISRPEASIASVVTGVSLPQPGRAWLTTDRGQLFAGTLAGGDWHWRRENGDGAGGTLGAAAGSPPIPLRAAAVDAAGKGYAVGDRGLVLERGGDGPQPWRIVDAGTREDLLSVTLSAGGAEAALIGGENGLVLTRSGDGLKAARPADPTDGASGDVTGLALLPGYEDGRVEAWAAVRHPAGEGAVLHYASEASEPLLDPRRHTAALRDAPAPRPGELTLAAFGKSDCLADSNTKCPDLSGTAAGHERIVRGVIEELRGRAARGAGPDLALSTGDAVDSSGTAAEVLSTGPAGHRRWAELVADPLSEAGVPVLGAIGGQDLSELSQCVPEQGCLKTKGLVKAGLNFPWRRAMARQPGGWGSKERITTNAGLTVTPVEERDPPGYVPDEDVKVADESVKPNTGSTRTHYAADVKTADGRPIARVVVVDTSLQSLSGSDPLQQPLEAKGGQQTWLENMLCEEGSGGGVAAPCTRKPSQQAIVVSNTPTYSYDPGAATETQADATAFESVLMKNHASLVVSGRLGWNGRYWATAPGVHEPCPGGGYQEAAPAAGARACGRSASDVPVDTPPAAQQLADSVKGLAPPPPPPADSLAGLAGGDGVLPFVVASSAGGKLADESGSADDGYWHGYSIARLDASGDPRRTIVEQRPILDWLSITAPNRVLRAGQHMSLHGVGREPLGVDGGARIDAIDSPAITHRYDLLRADPQRPYLPATDCERTGDNPAGYCQLPSDIGWIEEQGGKVTVAAGKGNHPRIYAIALLSVGDKAATYPLVFEPRKSYRPPAAKLLRALPLPKVRAAVAAPIQNPDAPPPVNTQTPSFDLPAPPVLVGLPLAAAAPPAPPAPPPPPPPPPVAPAATPLNLVAAPLGLNVAPTATVIPPPAPPIQPAPPSGARREAKQRQAAAARSEEGRGGEKEAAVSEERYNVDEATSGPTPPAAAMSRRDRVRLGPSMSLAAREKQPSAWGRDALYGGGLLLAAALLSTAWIGMGPRPRGRTPRAAPETQYDRTARSDRW